MKKIFLFFIFSLLISTGFAQGIQFEENHSLTGALAKAKAENKMVFIDAYASWCGPCKMMSAQIFPLKEVGDYFNAHFVNLKLDMEKGDNVAIAQKYSVSAYPTYLFLNSDGEVVHRSLGSMSAGEFIKVAQTASDVDNNTMSLTKKIKAGDRSYEVIKKYLEVNPYDKGNEQLVADYFNSLTDEQKTDKKAWDLFNQFIQSPKSEVSQYFLSNRKKYEEKIGKKETDNKLMKMFTYTYYRDKDNFEGLKSIDPELYEKTKEFARLNEVYGNFNKNKDNKVAWNTLIEKFDPYLTNTNAEPQALNSISWMVFENYKKFNDKKALKKALKWSEKAVKLAPDNDAIKDTYANILFDLGKKKDAVKAETEALELAKKNNNEEGIKTYTEVLEKFKK